MTTWSLQTARIVAAAAAVVAAGCHCRRFGSSSAGKIGIFVSTTSSSSPQIRRQQVGGHIKKITCFLILDYFFMQKERGGRLNQTTRINSMHNLRLLRESLIQWYYSKWRAGLPRFFERKFRYSASSVLPCGLRTCAQEKKTHKKRPHQQVVR